MMRKKIVGYVVLSWRFGPAPLVYVAEKALTHIGDPKEALFNPIFGPAHIFKTKRAAQKMVDATDKWQSLEPKSAVYMTRHEIIQVVEA